MTGTWPTYWATGDVVTAAEFAKGAGAIYDTTLGSDGGVDVQNITGSYAGLLLELYMRSNVVATNDTIVLRFNNDSGANYDYQRIYGSAAVATASEAFGQTTLTVGVCPGASAGAGDMSACHVFIPHYAGTSFNKVVIARTFVKWGTASGNMQARIDGGAWRSNSAINRILFTCSAGAPATGSRITIRALGA